MLTVFPNGSGVFQQDGAPCQSWFEVHDKVHRVQIAIQSSLCWMFWTNKSKAAASVLPIYLQRSCRVKVGAFMVAQGGTTQH